MSEPTASDSRSRATEVERLLAQGATIHPDTIAELLASGDEELALLGSYLVPGQEDLVLASAGEAPPLAFERLARRHAELLAGRALAPALGNRVELELAARRERDAAGAAGALPAGLPAETPATMTIIVHGAFAAGDTWWRPSGVFGRYIDERTGDLYRGADFFRWSGGGFHPDRLAAATALLAWVRQHPAGALDVISHSHGGNIVFLATQMGLEIRKHVSLATPICLDYFPDLRRIGILHNVISLADIIQVPASYIGVTHRGDGRSLADSHQLVNHLATRNSGGSAPSHSELHDPATWRASGLEARLLGPGSLPA